MKNRVVITGTGVLSSIGTTTEEFWNSCLKGIDSVETIPAEWRELCSFSSQFWSPLGHLPHYPEIELRTDRIQLDPCQTMAIHTAFEAVRNSGLKLVCTDKKNGVFRLEKIDPYESGIFVGTGAGGIGSLLSAHSFHNFSPFKEKFTPARTSALPLRFNPFTVPRMMVNGSADILGIRLSLSGMNKTVCTACSSGTMAIGEAFRAISEGRIRVAITGGVEFLDDPSGGIFRGFDAAGVLTKGKSAENCNAPFDVNRSGFLFSQGGCAMMVIETLDHALERNAPLIAEIKAYRENFEAFSLMGMEPEGTQIEQLLRSVLQDAETDSSEIDYINAHGTGTIINDQVESSVLSRIFGKGVAINSTKSLTGHALGASGAIETVITALSVKNDIVHGSKNLITPIDNNNFVKHTTHKRISNAITESFAFGGHNAALILGKI